MRPRDTIQYPDIKAIFQRYYRKIDLAIADTELVAGKPMVTLATDDPKALIEEVSKHQHAL